MKVIEELQIQNIDTHTKYDALLVEDNRLITHERNKTMVILLNRIEPIIWPNKFYERIEE